MKKIKVYNVIFPIWFLLFFPPAVFITLVGNYVFDSLVIVACFYIFKLSKIQTNLKTFYKESILKVWLFGFLADIIGAALLFLTGFLGDRFGLPNDVISGINYDPFSHPLAIIIILFSVIVSAFFIFLFNYKYVFKKQIEEKKLRLKLAITVAIVTMPWTFMMPTKWFYNGI